MLTLAFNQFDSHKPLLSKITCPLLITTFLGSHHPARYCVLDSEPTNSPNSCTTPQGISLSPCQQSFVPLHRGNKLAACQEAGGCGPHRRALHGCRCCPAERSCSAQAAANTLLLGPLFLCAAGVKRVWWCRLGTQVKSCMSTFFKNYEDFIDFWKGIILSKTFFL